MPALMIDSDDLAVLLESRFSDIRIATYADLITPQFIAAAGRRLKVIDRGRGDPHNLATIADIEPQLLTVEQGAAKIRQWNKEGRPQPTAYHDRAQWGAVNDALKGENYAHWVATGDGTLVPDGYYMAAVQFAFSATLGFHADMSIVWDDAWHPQPAAPSAAVLSRLIGAAHAVAIGSAAVLAELKAL